MQVIRILSSGAICATLLATSLAAADAQAAHRTVVRQNAEGGVTATEAMGRRGPNGAGVRRARGVATDGAGNATARSAAAVRGPNGGMARRAGSTQVNSDGSATHQSNVQATGAHGSTVQSSGSATRSADGSVTQSREASATNARTGNSVRSSVSYDSNTGVSRSATCYDASGAVIACR